jgi:MFS transporter, DHA1 family, tetracycline resistance protein
MADPVVPTPEAIPPYPDTEPAPTGAPGGSSRKAMFIVFLVVFIDLLGFGIVLPLLPLYAKDMLLPLLPGEENRPLRGPVLGAILSVFSLMQFVFAPIWGRISDRNGRRPILLLGLTGSVVFYALFGIASEVGESAPAVGLALLIAARIGAGIAGATISTAQAVIADSTTPANRSRGMALIGAAFGIGFTFGPILGFASLFVPWKGAPGFAASLFSLVALVLALRLLPETLPPGGVDRERHWLDLHGLRMVVGNPPVGILVLTFFLATMAFGGLESTLALVNVMLLNPEAAANPALAEEAAISPEVMQKSLLVFAYVGFVLMLAQGFLYRRLVQRVGEVPFMRVGIALMGLGLLGAVGVLLHWEAVGTRADVLVGALLSVTIGVVGFACLTPSVQALISRRSDPRTQGEILGVNQSASALARILGPMVGVSLFFATPSHILPYLLGAALLVVVFLLALTPSVSRGG